MKYLSKSDFKIAQDCPSKLWYKKKAYPSEMDNNEYMLMLADGGYMVGKMAQLLYTNGIVIEGTTKECIQRTEELLKLEKVILFEPAIETNNKLIRIDILIKDGSTFQLIEVKSKSYNSIDHKLAQQEGKKYFKSEWDPYFEDVTYQTYVLQEKFPEAKIDSFLMLPDKAKTTPIEGLIGWFRLKEVNQVGTFRNVDVEFTGDEKRLHEGHILSILEVNEEVGKRMNMVIEQAKSYIDSIINDIKIENPISISCKSCEYRVVDETHPQSGFEECWQDLAEAKDKKGKSVAHILELGQLGNINRFKGDGINQLISQGKVSLNDVPVEFLYTAKGGPAYNGRPLYQITEKEEFLLKGFGEEIAGIQYPLHFLDFETSQMAIPYHANMRPYEKVLFQWSCHTIDKPGAEPRHSEWINSLETYPNIEFVRSLMKLIGYSGTVMTWSAYENTQLKSMVEVLMSQDKPEKDLLDWIKHVAQLYKEDSSMIVDMNKLALQYYFHPMMGGRTSIKVTLPAVLSATKSKRIKKWLEAEGLHTLNPDGTIANPYDQLPKFEIMELAEVVKDGTGAMRAYQDMLYGVHRDNPDIVLNYKNALLKYCKLDTLAMVIIWEHWMELCK